jgi:hypothetical protein
MNFEDTLKKMIEAAAGAAKIHWKDFRTYAEQEFKRLAEAGAWLEADYIADIAAAELQKKAANREKAEAQSQVKSGAGIRYSSAGE